MASPTAVPGWLHGPERCQGHGGCALLPGDAAQQLLRSYKEMPEPGADLCRLSITHRGGTWRGEEEPRTPKAWRDSAQERGGVRDLHPPPIHPLNPGGVSPFRAMQNSGKKGVPCKVGTPPVGGQGLSAPQIPARAGDASSPHPFPFWAKPPRKELKMSCLCFGVVSMAGRGRG